MSDGFVPIAADDGFMPVTDDSSQAPSSLGSKVMTLAGKVGKSALEMLATPSQVLGEAIRGAGEGEPLKVATTSNQRGFRAPSIIQDAAPNLRTNQPPADPFTKAYQGLEGIANLPKGIQKASDVVTSKPDLAANLGGAALALGTGEAGNFPMTAITKPIGSGLKLAPKLLGELAEFSNVTKEADPAIQAAANEFHYPVTPAGLSQSPTQSAFEQVLANLPFAKDPLMQRYTDQLNSLKSMRDQLFQKGEATNRVDQEIEQQLASLIQDRIVGSSQNAYKASQGDYKAISNIAEGKSIPITNIEKTAQQIFEEQSKLPPASRSSGVSGILNDLKPQETPASDISDLIPKDITPAMKEQILNKYKSQDLGTDIGPKKFDYPTLQGIRADLNDRIAKADAAVNSGMPGMKFQSSPEAGVYKRLKSALDADLGDFGQQKGNEGVSQAMDKANSNYSTYKQIFKENPLVTSIVKQQNPTDAIKIASRALLKQNNLAESGTLQNILGNDAYSYLSDHLATTLTSKNGQFSPSAIVSNYDKLGDQAITNILGEDKMKVFRPLYLLAKASQNAEKTANNPSGTGRMIGAMATMIRPMIQMLTGHVASGASTLGAEMAALPTIAKGYLSPTAMQLLTRQPIQLGEDISRAAEPFMKTGNAISRTSAPLLGAINQNGSQD